MNPIMTRTAPGVPFIPCNVPMSAWQRARRAGREGMQEGDTNEVINRQAKGTQWKTTRGGESLPL